MLGYLVEDRLLGLFEYAGFAENIAKKLVSPTDRSPEGNITSDVYESRVKRMANMISALAPFLALIASIITSYFGYLAALAAAAKK